MSELTGSAPIDPSTAKGQGDNTEPRTTLSGGRRRIPLLWQILIGLAAGILIGAILNHFPDQRDWWNANIFQPLGDVFIKLMQMIVVPIVFSCMVVAVAGHGDSKALGRMGAKTLGYFFFVTTLAIIIGLVSANLLEPGSGADIAAAKAAEVNTARSGGDDHSIAKIVLGIIPSNIVSSMAEGKLLAVLFFAILFGLGISRLPEDRKQPIVTLFRSVADAMFNVTAIVIAYSPIGVFGMIAVTVSTFGLSSLFPLAKLIGVSYVTILFFAGIVLPVIARIAGVPYLRLIAHIKDELVLAFSTASSAAVMPQLMAKLQTFGVPPRIVSFVVPVGYSFNLDGASLFLGIGTLFVAQLFGIELSLTDQAILVVTMVLTSKGAAGVPGFMFVLLSATLGSAGLPLEGIAFIAGVYRLMDMPTTALNVLGNALAPLIIAKWEGELGAPGVPGGISPAQDPDR